MNTNNGWLDIASAPKDRTPIIIACIGEGRVYDVCNGHIEVLLEDEQDGPWGIDGGEPFCSYVGRPAGEYFCCWLPGKEWEDRWKIGPSFEYTHWMPLPAAPGAPAETPAYTVTVDPDPRGVSIGVYQGSSCVYHGAHAVPASTVADEGAKDELATYSLQPVATAFFTEKGEVAYTGIYDRTLKALESVKTTRMGISAGSIDLYHRPVSAPAAGDARDAARLDFLFTRQATVIHDETSADGYWLQFRKEDGSTWVQVGEYPTPRAAIDAAIAASKQGGE